METERFSCSRSSGFSVSCPQKIFRRHATKTVLLRTQVNPRPTHLWGKKASIIAPVRRRQWHPTPVLMPGKSHGRRSLVGGSPGGRRESDQTDRFHFHFSLWCIEEGNGNPLQCSCLENLRDGGAWWAAVYGVAQSWTRLKWLSSSSGRGAGWKFEPFIQGRTHYWRPFKGLEIYVGK